LTTSGRISRVLGFLGPVGHHQGKALKALQDHVTNGIDRLQLSTAL